MSGRFLSLLSCIFLLLMGFSHYAEGNEETLFSKMKISLFKEMKRAPAFTLENLNGKKEELKDYRGKVVFLNLWATWCSPCREEMPSIEKLSREFKEKEFAFLTIAVDYGGKKAVKAFIAKHRYTFPVLLDPKCGILDLYHVKGIPTTLIVDKQGMLIGSAIGPRDWQGPEAISIVEHLLRKN
jgi:peroxiredoxin